MLNHLMFRAAIICAALVLPLAAQAGSIFLTGHDPDFHASLGGNLTGARNINTTAINFITDPAFNSFKANGVNKFLFVESSISPPSGHTVGKNGIVASGYAEGTDFVHANASTLSAALDQLGTTYNAIVVASDYGGILTSAELNILNARSSDIISFLNAGGGIYAMAESNSQGALTTGSTLFGFLPFIFSTTQFNQTEIGITVTPFGASLGLTNADVNGNASHNIFNDDFGLNIVDLDSQSNILTIAGRAQVTPIGVVPEPETYAMLLAGLGLLGFVVRRRKLEANTTA